MGLEDSQRKSANEIMKVAHKVRQATPETIEALKRQLDDVFSRELKNTGTKAQSLIIEKEKALEHARKVIEKIKTERKETGAAAPIGSGTAVSPAAVAAQAAAKAVSLAATSPPAAAPSNLPAAPAVTVLPPGAVPVF